MDREKPVKRISAVEFRLRTSQYPSWCSKLTEPLEVFGKLDMNGWNITHLSPFLTFTKDKTGEGGVSFRRCHLELVAGTFLGTMDGSGGEQIAADFEGCKIEKLEGSFHGKIECFQATIGEIGNLEVLKPSDRGSAANFEHVTGLKTARGKFKGAVEFHASSIEEIDNDPETGLVIINSWGNAASFHACMNLKIARGTFFGAVDFTKSGIEEIDPDPTTGLVIRQSHGPCAVFNRCANLTVLQGRFPTIVTAGNSGVARIQNFTCEEPQGNVCCTLENTPILKKDPVAAGQAMFGMRGCDLDALRETAIKHHHEWEGCPEIIRGVENAKKARNALKKGQPNFEL